jgi:hypothetical protein
VQKPRSSIYRAIGLLMAGIPVLLAQIPQQSPDDRAMTDSTVVQMVQAGVASDLILNQIAECEPHFLLTPGALIQLKQYGVPDSLVRAMAAKQHGEPIPGLIPPPATPPAVKPTASMPNRPSLAVFSPKDGTPPPRGGPSNPASSAGQAPTSAAFVKHGREYKPAMVLDSSMSQASYVTGAVTNGYTSGTASSTTNGTFDSLTTGPIQSGSFQATSTGTVNAQSSRTTSLQYVTVQTNELLLVGDRYFYIIADSTQRGNTLLAYAVTNRLVNRKHGCRFIVGEETMYSQEKGKLHIIDVDGKECNVPIIRQEKR